MSSNPVQFSYNENYMKPTINSLNVVTIEYLDGPVSPTRRLVLPCLSSAEYFSSRVVELKKLGCTWREVYQVKFDRAFVFTPGDSIGLLCPNSESLVSEIMEILGVGDFDCKIERSGKKPFSYAGTIREFFKHYFDFTTLPRKAMLMRLSRSCGEVEKKQMEYLCSREGTKDYLRMGGRWNNVIDIIKTFGSRPSLEDMLGDCEVIKPRYFSLINRTGEESEIIVGVMSKTFDGVLRYGHVSGYITGSVTDKIEVCLRTNVLFRMDGSLRKVFGICTGTGIAPFLSFVANLQQQKLWLLYGFRNNEDDILGDLSDERVQVTRVKSSDGEYVTDYIRANIDSVRKYLSDGCPVYVCGGMQMQREVYKLFKDEFRDVVEGRRLVFDSWS